VKLGKVVPGLPHCVLLLAANSRQEVVHFSCSIADWPGQGPAGKQEYEYCFAEYEYCFAEHEYRFR
jgi:hypothetical protein